MGRYLRSFEKFDTYWLSGYVKAFYYHGDGMPLLFFCPFLPICLTGDYCYCRGGLSENIKYGTTQPIMKSVFCFVLTIIPLNGVFRGMIYNCVFC